MKKYFITKTFFAVVLTIYYRAEIKIDLSQRTAKTVYSSTSCWIPTDLSYHTWNVLFYFTL